MIKSIIESIAPISSSSLIEIESGITNEDIIKGATFIQKNRRNHDEYFILEGVCRSYVINPEGDEVTISFYTSGSILPPYNTRTKNEISVLNFQALTDVSVATINAAEFEKMMVNNREIRNFGHNVLRNELAQKVDKEIGMACLTARERLLKFREQFPMLENIVAHTDIASYLGITNISLSRLRSDLMR